MKTTKTKVKTIQTLDEMILAMKSGLHTAMVNVQKSTLNDRKVKVTVMKLILVDVNKLNAHYGVKVESGHANFKDILDVQGLGSYSTFKKYRTLINEPDELKKYLNGERDLNPLKGETGDDVKSTDEILKSINKKLANIKKLVSDKLPDYEITVKDKNLVVEKIEKQPTRRQPTKHVESVAVLN